MIDSCYIIRCFHKSAFSRFSRLRLSVPLQSLWLIARQQTSYVCEIILYFSRKQIMCEKNHHFLEFLHTVCPSLWRRIFLGWLHIQRIHLFIIKFLCLFLCLLHIRTGNICGSRHCVIFCDLLSTQTLLNHSCYLKTVSTVWIIVIRILFKYIHIGKPWGYEIV